METFWLQETCVTTAWHVWYFQKDYAFLTSFLCRVIDQFTSIGNVAEN
jgi:hypothetical protein